MSDIRKIQDLPITAPIHFIGVLGAGMLPLANLLISRGYRVSGSDRREPSFPLPQGIEFWQGHEPERIAPDALCVYSLAIPEDDVERAFATSRGQTVISRPRLLGMLVAEYAASVGVAGSHGKSTVTAMLSHLLADLSPTVLCGADIGEHGLVRGGDGLLVYEACEYRDAFLATQPTVALLLNLELDHTDYFADIHALERSFARFSASAELTVYNADDESLLRIMQGTEANAVSFGASSLADYRYEILSVSDVTRFAVYHRGEPLGEFCLQLPGSFNLKNALAAIALATELGVPADTAARRLAGFRGIPRRLERIATRSGYPVIYDYAHHPTEIAAGIDAVRAEGQEQVTVVFRPHTYTRTASLWDGFVRALRRADRVILLDVFAAREEAIVGIDSRNLALAIGERATYARSDTEAALLLLEQPPCATMLMGAGDLDGVKKILEKNC